MSEMTGLDREPKAVPDQAVEVLVSGLHGPVLRPGAPGYDESSCLWNGMIEKKPALVVQPVGSADVREAVRFASAHEVLLSVKGGGHGIAGTSLTDGGLTLDMSRMRRVAVDPQRRLAYVDAGCRLGDVDQATQEFGLATVLGSDRETGVAGLTVGGGFGRLARRFGWTVDNVEEVEIVTADGEIRRAAADENEDLFWAVRGGGGSFGIVTRFTFRLHEVGPEVTGGLILWGAERADEVLALFREMTESAPREVTLVLTIRFAPAIPQIPADWHGKRVIAIGVCHSGSSSQAAHDLAPLRHIGEPIVDLVRRKTYVEEQAVMGAPQPNGLHYYWKSEFLAGLSRPSLQTFRDRAMDNNAPMSQVILFHLGGAVADRPASYTAFGNRDARYGFFAAGCWRPGSAQAAAYQAWVRSTWQAMEPYSTGGNYINAQTADEDSSRLRGAYLDSLDRLAEVKAAYDPDNLFRVDRDIVAAAKA